MNTISIKRFIAIAATTAVTFASGAVGVYAGDGIDQMNGTIIDSYTGLVWLKNANCFGAKSWQEASDSVAGLQSGKCGLNDKSKAGQWRLPSDTEQIIRMARTSGFVNIQTGYYWTSTHPASYSPNDYYAVTVGSATWFDKANAFYVWPVRNAK